MIPTRSSHGRPSMGPLAVLAVLFAATLAPSAYAQSNKMIPVAQSEGEYRWPGYVPNELLVQFRERITPEERQAAARAEGATVAREVTSDGLVTIRLAPGETVVGALPKWNARPEVEYAAPKLYARSFFTPNDTTIATFDLAWNLRAVRAYDAWDIARGDPSIVLAIIDTGVAYENFAIPAYELQFVKPGVTTYLQSPELPGPFLPGYDFVHDDTHPNDDNGHGTTVATIAAGQANNIAGSAGVAFGVTILPIKVADYQSDSDMEWIVKGIRFAADHGADVANMSFGFPPRRLWLLNGYTNDFLAHMFKPLRDAIAYAQRKGVILVGATGNSSAPEVSLPAAYTGVIAVGATGPDNTRASYSSYGTDLDFMAPGGDFGDVNGDHVQDGVAVLSIKPHRSAGSLAAPDSFDVFVSFGTSNAAPHVAGAVALLRSMGMRDQGAIEQVLRATAVNPFQTTQAFDIQYGNGLIQLDAALLRAAGASLAPLPPDDSRGALRARLASSNPTRGTSRVAYRLTHAGAVRVRVFDARGALVRTIDERSAPAGEHEAAWDGRRADGTPAASGIYWLRIDAEEGSAVRKFAYLR